MPSNVPNMLSPMFFSLCMTSKLCLISNFSQYSNWKRTLFFLQLCHLVSSSRYFLFLVPCPNFGCSKLSYCCRTSSLVSGTGASLVSTLLLKLLLFLRHLWFCGKKRRWPR
jgi:hypothetical protein